MGGQNEMYVTCCNDCVFVKGGGCFHIYSQNRATSWKNMTKHEHMKSVLSFRHGACSETKRVQSAMVLYANIAYIPQNITNISNTLINGSVSQTHKSVLGSSEV